MTASGQEVPSLGEVDCKLTLQGSTFSLRAVIMPTMVGNSFDVILGTDWLGAHQAVLDYGTHTMKLTTGRNRVLTLGGHNDPQVATARKVVDCCVSCLGSAETIPIITAKQAGYAGRTSTVMSLVNEELPLSYLQGRALGCAP